MPKRFFMDLRRNWQDYWKGKPLVESLDPPTANIYRENETLRLANDDMWLRYAKLCRQLSQSGKAHERKNRTIKRLRAKLAAYPPASVKEGK